MEKIKLQGLTLESVNVDTAWLIIACDKDVESVVLPCEAEGRAVVGIGEYAFENCTHLQELVFPDTPHGDVWEGVDYDIGAYAFSGCSRLSGVSLPHYLSSVGRGAFYGCKSLLSASWYKYTYVAPYAFAYCEALTDIPVLREVSEGEFIGCSSLASITLTAECEHIDEDAFEGCTALGEVVIPKSVKRIEALAFRSCIGLRRVEFLNPEGWYFSSSYDELERPLDLSDPEKCALWLSRMDFDDGVVAWYRRDGEP